MSHGYKSKRKALRREKDKLNPERVRIRGLIRKRILPAYRLVTQKIRKIHWKTKEPTGFLGFKVIGMKSVFKELTK